MSLTFGLEKWKWKLFSCVWLFAAPWTICPWNSPSQNIGVGSLSLLQRIFQTQGSNPGLPHCRQILYQLSHKGNPFGLGHILILASWVLETMRPVTAWLDHWICSAWPCCIWPSPCHHEKCRSSWWGLGHHTNSVASCPEQLYLHTLFSSVQSFSHVWLFATPWIAAHQASLSITNSQSLLKPMSIASVMPSNHLILIIPFSSHLQSLPAKVRLVKAMVFPAVVYGYESWPIQKTELQIINASELWCWRKLLIVPWTARRSH